MCDTIIFYMPKTTRNEKSCLEKFHLDPKGYWCESTIITQIKWQVGKVKLQTLSVGIGMATGYLGLLAI